MNVFVVFERVRDKEEAFDWMHVCEKKKERDKEYECVCI